MEQNGQFDTSFQYAALCKLLGFTPTTSDAPIPVFGEYIDFVS